MADDTTCADLADALAEVATGAASGADRALVLGHLAECDDCRRELEELTKVADEVLLVAPEHEPPAGFESAVLARIAQLKDADTPSTPDARPTPGGPAETPAVPATVTPIRRRRTVRYVALAAAAAVIGLGGAGIVWQTTSDERRLAENYRETLAQANGRYFTAAPLIDSAGAEIGHVFLYQGEPSWLFAALIDAPAPGVYDVVVTTDDWTRSVDTCEVEVAGCGAGNTIDADIRDVREIQLVAADGTTVSTARRDRD